jgi:hypothetical protein
MILLFFGVLEFHPRLNCVVCRQRKRRKKSWERKAPSLPVSGRGGVRESTEKERAASPTPAKLCVSLSIGSSKHSTSSGGETASLAGPKVKLNLLGRFGDVATLLLE